MLLEERFQGSNSTRLWSRGVKRVTIRPGLPETEIWLIARGQAGAVGRFHVRPDLYIPRRRKTRFLRLAGLNNHFR